MGRRARLGELAASLEALAGIDLGRVPASQGKTHRWAETLAARRRSLGERHRLLRWALAALTDAAAG